MVANSIEWRGVPDSDDDVSIPPLRGVAEVTSESRWSNLDALYIRFVVLLVRNIATRCTPLSLGHTLALCCCSRDIHEIQVHAQTLGNGRQRRLKPESTPTFPRREAGPRQIPSPPAGRIVTRQLKVRVI
jgi:hypothetical protein